MKKCANCGKKLGTFNKYYHPSFEKRWLFCSNCYNEIEKKGSPYIDKLRKELSEEK